MEGGTTHNSIIYQNYVANTSKIGIEVTGTPPCGEGNTCGEGHQILDNTLVNSPIILNGAQRATVARNRISGSLDRGRTGDFGGALFLVASSVSQILIENNLIYDNEGSGMIIKPQGPGNLTIRGNLLKNNCLGPDEIGGNLAIWTQGHTSRQKSSRREQHRDREYRLRLRDALDNNGGAGGGSLDRLGDLSRRSLLDRLDGRCPDR